MYKIIQNMAILKNITYKYIKALNSIKYTVKSIFSVPWFKFPLI